MTSDMVMARISIKRRGDRYWVICEAQPEIDEIGPLETLDEANRAFECLKTMIAATGGCELPDELN